MAASSWSSTSPACSSTRRSAPLRDVAPSTEDRRSPHAGGHAAPAAPRSRRRLDPKTGPPHLEVWRSIRAHGDTKTRKSRRTIDLSGLCVDALRAQRVQQAKDRLAAGEQRTETGLVLATSAG